MEAAGETKDRAGSIRAVTSLVTFLVVAIAASVSTLYPWLAPDGPTVRAGIDGFAPGAVYGLETREGLIILISSILLLAATSAVLATHRSLRLAIPVLAFIMLGAVISVLVTPERHYGSVWGRKLGASIQVLYPLENASDEGAGVDFSQTAPGPLAAAREVSRGVEVDPEPAAFAAGLCAVLLLALWWKYLRRLHIIQPSKRPRVVALGVTVGTATAILGLFPRWDTSLRAIFGGHFGFPLAEILHGYAFPWSRVLLVVAIASASVGSMAVVVTRVRIAWMSIAIAIAVSGLAFIAERSMPADQEEAAVWEWGRPRVGLPGGQPEDGPYSPERLRNEIAPQVPKVGGLLILMTGLLTLRMTTPPPGTDSQFVRKQAFYVRGLSESDS